MHKILAKQTNKPVPVVRRVNNALHRINLYPVDSAVVLLTLVRWIALSALYTTGPLKTKEQTVRVRDSCVTDKKTTAETVREILA